MIVDNDSSDLDLALQQYAIALQQLVDFTSSLTQPFRSTENLTTSPSNPSSIPSLILNVLTARDYVQVTLKDISLTKIPHAYGSSKLDQLSQLDKSLRNQSAVITALPEYMDWRTSLAPDEESWWWFLEAPKRDWSDHFDAVWSTISITALTISLGLLGDIAPRFLTGVPDSFAAVAVSAQSILTLIATGGVLTKTGQNGLKQTLKTIHLPEKYWHELGAAGALLLMMGFLGLRQSLPWIATHYYTNPAIKSRQIGEWGTAEMQFKRAIQLNADDAQAQFHLGNLYEDLQLIDQARPQYQRAFQGGVIAAANNLARLNILKKDYSASISLLLKALDTDNQKPLDTKTKHAVLKNLGWARFEQKNYDEAEAHLLDAIDLESTKKFYDAFIDPFNNNEDNVNVRRAAIASAHCLFAQVMEEQNNKKEALAAWKVCADNAEPTIPEQDAWKLIAQKRLLVEVAGK